MLRPRHSQADRLARPSQAFIRAVAREILRMQREVYPEGADPHSKGMQWSRQPWAGLQMAIVTTAITQASGTTYGSGYAQLYYSEDPDDSFGTADPDWTSTWNPVTNWYTTSGTIASGKHCFVAPTALVSRSLFGSADR